MIPEFGNGLSELPVFLGTETLVNGDLHDRNFSEFLAKHESEWNEYAVVESRS